MKCFTRCQAAAHTLHVLVTHRACPAHGRTDSHASGAAKPDAHAIAVHEHRHAPLTLAVDQHPTEIGRTALHVHVLEFLATRREILN